MAENTGPDLASFGSAPEGSGITDEMLEVAASERDLAEIVGDKSATESMSKMLNEALRQSKNEASFTKICNEGLDKGRVTEHDARTWMKSGLEQIAVGNPATAALVMRALAQVDGLASRYSRMAPELAAAMLLRDSERIADLVGTDDNLSLQAWMENRQRQIEAKRRGDAPSRSFSGMTPKQRDKMPVGDWLKARNAELKRKGGR